MVAASSISAGFSVRRVAFDPAPAPAHRRYARARRSRRGAVVVLAAFMIMALLAVAAFVVDLGHLGLAKAQLQDAADSAALAGAAVMAQGPEAARREAQRFAELNFVGKAPIKFNPAEDVVFGHWDRATRTFTPLRGTAETFANSLKVTCRLCAARGNAPRLFFASTSQGQGSGGNTFPAGDISASTLALAQCTQCGPFIGLNSVSMSGAASTDSYNSLLGPYSRTTAGALGNVCSNGSITLSGAATICGNANPGPAHLVTLSGAAHVTGSTQPRSVPLQIPPVNFGSSAAINNNQNIPLSAKGKHPLNSNGDFSLSGHDSVALLPGTYYFASVTLSGSSSVAITGKTVIYCTGNFNGSGGSLTNATHTPGNLQVYCTGQQCTLSGSSGFYGTVYAPTTEITVSGSGDLYGMLIGSQLVVSGDAGLHFDTSLPPLTGCTAIPRIYF